MLNKNIVPPSPLYPCIHRATFFSTLASCPVVLITAMRALAARNAPNSVGSLPDGGVPPLNDQDATASHLIHLLAPLTYRLPTLASVHAHLLVAAYCAGTARHQLAGDAALAGGIVKARQMSMDNLRVLNEGDLEWVQEKRG